MNMPTSVIRPLCALVVDDDADTAETTAELLALHGFRVLTATTSRDAVLAASGELPDVALLDLALPDISGFEVARQIRDVCAGADKRPLFVAVTGFGTEADVCRTSEAGFDLHLTKPVDPPLLVGILRRFARLLTDPRTAN
ncbi:MAG: response regulator [Planctomycetia bacterium]|nr:response regulator [Planctomycetia bacterium]